MIDASAKKPPQGMIDKFEEAFGKGTPTSRPPAIRVLRHRHGLRANFIFERDRVGSYLAGYAPPEASRWPGPWPPRFRFPPLFGPLRIDRAERFKGGRMRASAPMSDRADPEDLRVTDGGVYDNMGLEPVWKNHRVVLVSDAGGLMDAEADRNWTWRIQRYQSIQTRKREPLRKRFPHLGYTQGTINGAYFGVASSPDPLSGRARSRLLEGVRDGRHQKHPHRPRRLQRSGAGGADESRVWLVDAAIRTHAGVDRGGCGVRAAVSGVRCVGDQRGGSGRRLAGSGEKRKLTGRH